MPRPETSHRNQKAVYGPAPSTGNPSDADRYGQPKKGTWVEIDVRIIKGRKEAVDTHGNKYAIDLSMVVDRDVPLGSTVWIGELDDLPDSPTDLYYVTNYREVPDVKGTRFRRTIELMRLGNTVPASA